MRSQLGIAAIAGAALVVACSSLTGADDLYTVADSGGGGVSSSSGDPGADGGGSIGGEGGGGGGDGGTDPPLPQCGAGVCVPTADGWTPATRPAFFGVGSCPAGWPTRPVYKTADSFQCTCACTPTAGSCVGPLFIATGMALSCPGIPTPLPDLPPDGGCVTASLGPGAGTPIKVTAQPVSPPTACTGVPQPVGGGADDVAVCSGGAAAPSVECKPSESCVAKPTTNSEVCIVHDGLLPCPAGFGRRMEITTGAVDDQRTCSSSCTCDPSCNGGRIEAFYGDACNNSAGSVTLGECGISAAVQGSSLRYFASNGCRVAQAPTVQGTVTLEAPKTLCCARGGLFGG